MDKQDQRKTQETGHENHGVYLCHKCGWPFPNPHPSPKHRRAHKRICGTIEGYKLIKTDDDTSHVHLANEEHHSDEDRRYTPSPRDLESSNSQKPVGGVGERLISGDEVFADAVAEFSDGGWNSGAEENLRENLEPVPVKDDSTHVSDNDGFGGRAVATENQLMKNPTDSNQMQNPETPKTASLLEKVPNCRTEEQEVQFFDDKPGLPSEIYPKKDEGSIDGLHEGVSIDGGNGVTESTVSLQVDAADKFDRNLALREAPIRIFEETSKLNVNDVASSDTEGARDFVSKKENSAEGFLETHQIAHSLDVELLQHPSISANNSQVDLGLHNLQEGEEKDENACEISVPDGISNPTILIEDSEDPKGVKLQISPILQSHETIRNVDDDLKDVISVERLIVLQSESSSMACEVPPGESYVVEHNAMQQNDSYKLTVTEEPRKQQIVEPLVEGKTNLDQSADDNGASLVDIVRDMDGQMGSLSQEQDSDDFCKFLEVNSSDFPVFTSNVVPAHVSVCSVDHDKDTIGHDRPNGVIEKSDCAVRISTLQSDSKEPLLQKAPVNIVDGEDVSNHEKLETRSHDTVGFHFKESSMESEGNHHETYQTAGLIYNDDSHHVVEIKIDGVPIDGSDKPEADTEKHDDETKTATHQPSESLSHSQEKPSVNKAADYGLGVCEAGDIKNIIRVEDQSLAGPLGKNTLPFKSDCGSEMGDESVKKSQSILCKQSLHVSGSEQETNQDDTDIIGRVSIERERHADASFDLPTVNVIQDKEMEDPISKGNQTKGFRGEAGRLLSAPIQDQGGNDLVKQQSCVSGIDGSVGIFSRSDSLECNWGSVSVLSLPSDAQAILDAETLPLVDSHSSTEGNSDFKTNAAYDFQPEKSELSEPPSFMTLVEPRNEGQMNAAMSEGQTGQNPRHPTSTPLQASWFPSLPQVANDSVGRKKNEEIIAKVTNWNTGKHHAPLESLLSEVAQDTNPKAPTTKEYPSLENQKSEKAAEDNGAMTTTTTVYSILGPESPATQVAKKEIAKEWNSPARYPSDIQREKRKVRGRPFWTQFVCCTSVNSQ